MDGTSIGSQGPFPSVPPLSRLDVNAYKQLQAASQAGRVKTVFKGDRLDLETVKPALAPIETGRPMVFLNYDETLTEPVLSRDFHTIGQPLFPKAAAFDLASSHANGNPKSPLLVGFRLTNHGPTPMTLRVSNPLVGAHGVPAPKDDGFNQRAKMVHGAWTITLPRGAHLDFPAGLVDAHPDNGQLRDGSRMVTYNAHAEVIQGDAHALEVRDVARFIYSNNKSPHMLPDSVDKKHHEGVFLPSQQISPPVLLSPGVSAAFEIAGSQETHDAHYETVHTFFVALSKDATPKALVFRGGGGGTQPMINGHLLPRAVGVTPAVDAQGQAVTEDGFTVLKQQQEFVVPISDSARYLKPTGQKDEGGNPIYQVDVTFLPGSNGDLGLYAQY